ncbi:MAG: histidine kinase [Flavitalea sp.]
MIPSLNYNSLFNRLPKYTGKDAWLFWSLVPLLTVLLNTAMFANSYFSELPVTVLATIASFALLTGLWFILSSVAVMARTHFSGERTPVRRVATTICLFIIITALYVTIIHWLYDSTDFLGFDFNEKRYRWTLIVGIILNTFITLLQEGIAGFENWKATMVETEQLKKEYMQSQLLGLKSQVNPHFLFNSLNSLSSLISENQDEAEKFLDEMSKVYRYLLRNSDDQLVSLETELQFVNSYFHLLKARYSDGIRLEFDIKEKDLEMNLPPLTLQMLIEAAYNQNVINKDKPLTISISSVPAGWLRVKNNVEKKIADDQADLSGLENVANKFRLLCQKSIIIEQTDEFYSVELPLIPPSENENL